MPRRPVVRFVDQLIYDVGGPGLFRRRRVNPGKVTRLEKKSRFTQQRQRRKKNERPN